MTQPERPKVPCPQCSRQDFTYWNAEKRQWFCWKNEERKKYGCGYAWDEAGQPVQGRSSSPAPATPAPVYTPPNQYPVQQPPAPPPPAAPGVPVVSNGAVLVTVYNARGEQIRVRISFE